MAAARGPSRCRAGDMAGSPSYEGTSGGVRPWRVALPGVAVQIAFGLSFVWGAVAPAVRNSEHWSPLVIGAVFSAVPLGYALGTVVGGRLAERLNPRSLCLGALGLLGIGLTVAFVVPNSATFIFFYSGLGLGVGGGIALAGTLAAGAQVLGGRIGALAGLLTGAYASAAIIEAPLVSTLTALTGWLNALRMVGGVDLLLAVVGVLALPGLSTPQRGRGGSSPAPTLTLLRRPTVFIAASIELLGTPAGAYAMVHVALHAKGLGMPAAVVFVAVPAAALGNTIGRLAGGVASDRFGPDRLLFLVFAGATAAAVVLASTRDSAALLGASFVAGVGFGGAAGLVASLALYAVPESPHAGFGVLFAAFALGAFAGPLIGPAVGGGTAAWLVLAAMAGVAFGLSMLRMAVSRSPASR